MVKNYLNLNFFFARVCLLIFLVLNTATAEVETTHAIAMHGKAKYPSNFSHFDYANPDATKGGQIKLFALGTFDSFNAFISKGMPAEGVDLIYDSLTTASGDEAFTQYGLLAERIEMPADRSWVIYHLNPQAKFHDGHAVTAADVVFTFNTLLEKAKPFYQYYYSSVKEVKALDDQRVKFSFAPGTNRELALTVGQVSILPQHYWQQHDFTKANLEVPLGSGPYKIESFNSGKSIIYSRNANYWGKDLPVNRGRYNFNSVRYDYYRDGAVALEGFKAGSYDFRLENNSKLWATSYTGPAIENGLIIREKIAHEQSSGMQGFIFNMRRSLFKDKRVREALNYAFDFEWANEHLFYTQYTRTESYFSNTELAARGLPSAAELAILEPFRAQLPPEVFTQVYSAPQTDGSGNIRANLKKAQQLLQAAGFIIENNQLIDAKTKQPFSFEFLLSDTAFERIVLPFKKNLEKLGIQMLIRRVDQPQYIDRLRNFDFDMIIHTYPQSLSPGNEQRESWSSASARIPDSRNLIGIENPVVDHLVDLVITARDREELINRVRALDRVLLWQHYLIPNWHIRYHRVAYWNKLEHPSVIPKYNLDLFTWWINQEKAALLPQTQKTTAK